MTSPYTNPGTLPESPQGWSIRSIESLCLRVTSGGTPLRSNPLFYDNGTVRWVKTKELKDWYIDDTEEKITSFAIERSSAKLFPPDTVLMAMYGDGRTITSLGILKGESATNQACCAMIVNREECEPLFLFYSLKYHREEFLHLATGGAQRNLSTQIIKNFRLAVPPITIQRQIVSILSAYDFLIENNTRRIAILEEMAQALYREWFVEFRFPGYEQVRMVDSPLGPVPVAIKCAILALTATVFR
jgi:type I restriction enzyme S subunit